MKTLILLFLSGSFLVISFVSCKKDYSAYATRTYCDTLVIHDTLGIVHDTIRIHDTIAPVPLTKTQILTQKDWIVDEVDRNISGTNSHYVRNGVNTTGTIYSNLGFHFNANGSGTYTDETSVTHTLNWNFTSSDQTNMQLNIGPPSATTYNWNIIELKNNFLYNSTMQGSLLVTARFIQVP